MSLKRINSFLNEEELDPDNIDCRDKPAVDDEEAVLIREGSFTWDTPDRFSLSKLVKCQIYTTCMGHTQY